MRKSINKIGNEINPWIFVSMRMGKGKATFNGNAKVCEMRTKVIHLSFAFPWLNPWDTPWGLFFVTNKNHLKPLGKGHKIND